MLSQVGLLIGFGNRVIGRREFELVQRKSSVLFLPLVSTSESFGSSFFFGMYLGLDLHVTLIYFFSRCSDGSLPEPVSRLIPLRMQCYAVELWAYRFHESSSNFASY